MADTFQPIGAVAVNVMAQAGKGRRRKQLFQSARHAVSFFARSAAKQAVKQKLRDDDARLSLVPVRVIAEQTERYLEQHPELYQQALERARQMGMGVLGSEASCSIVFGAGNGVGCCDLRMARSNCDAKSVPSKCPCATALNFGFSYGRLSIAALILAGVASIGLR